MWTLKLGRGPSFQRAVGGLVAGLFGVLWTVLAVEITAESPLPYVAIVFPAFGVLITALGWGLAIYHFVHATSQQQFAEYDFVRTPDAPAGSARRCAACHAALESSFRYCPQCGTKA